MSGNTKITYNTNMIKDSITWNILSIIFKWKGIIFGGFVRDHIISCHYAHLFYEKNPDKSQQYWNEQYEPETAPRTLVANDIDVCLYEEKDVYSMMNEISALLFEKFGETNVKKENKKNFMMRRDLKSYIDNPLGNLNTFVYTITVGVIPFVSTGTQFELMFDVITASQKHILPPFYKLDFLCNAFIMKDHDDIMLSGYTGTKLDRLKLVDRKEIESKIIKDIVQFKTDYCKKFLAIAESNIYASVKFNEQACKRIEKMCKKKYAWSIGNLPILIDKPNKISFVKNSCCICMDCIKKNEQIVSMPSFDSSNRMIATTHMHTNCFFKYMSSQIQNKKNDYDMDSYNYNAIDGSTNYETNCKVFLKCPMRKMIDLDTVDMLESVIERYLKY